VKFFGAIVFLLLVPQARAAEPASATLYFERVNAPSATVVYFADGRECTGRTTLGAGGSLGEGAAVAIGAGREVAFWLRQEQGRQAFGPLNVAEVCELIVSFAPAPGASYRLTYRVSPDGKQCGAAVARLDTGGAVSEPTFRIREPLVPGDETRPACAPLIDKP
jgi:hypothetical protein